MSLSDSVKDFRDEDASALDLHFHNALCHAEPFGRAFRFCESFPLVSGTRVDDDSGSGRLLVDEDCG